jgi:hypothetical protein
MTYEELLKKAPAHGSKRFLEFLKQNNKVVFDNDQWLVIENFKYHTAHHPWYTAFWKGDPKDPDQAWYHDVDILWYHNDWGHWEWVKKSADKQTIKRFHIHLHRPPA